MATSATSAKTITLGGPEQFYSATYRVTGRVAYPKVDASITSALSDRNRPSTHSWKSWRMRLQRQTQVAPGQPSEWATQRTETGYVHDASPSNRTFGDFTRNTNRAFRLVVDFYNDNDHQVHSFNITTGNFY